MDDPRQPSAPPVGMQPLVGQPEVQQQELSEMEEQQLPLMGRQEPPVMWKGEQPIGWQSPPPPPVHPEMWPKGQPVVWQQGQPQPGQPVVWQQGQQQPPPGQPVVWQQGQPQPPPGQPVVWQQGQPQPGQPVVWQQGQPQPPPGQPVVWQPQPLPGQPDVWQQGPQLGPPPGQPEVSQQGQPPTELEVDEPHPPQKSWLPVVNGCCCCSLNCAIKMQTWVILIVEAFIITVGTMVLSVGKICTGAEIPVEDPVTTTEGPFSRSIRSPYANRKTTVHHHHYNSNRYNNNHYNNYHNNDLHYVGSGHGRPALLECISQTSAILIGITTFMTLINLVAALFFSTGNGRIRGARFYIITLLFVAIIDLVDVVYLSVMGQLWALTGIVFIGVLIYTMICANTLHLKRLNEKRRDTL